VHDLNKTFYMVCTLEVIDIDVVMDGEVILKDLNLSFKAPGLYQIIGPNGSGKTTLFRTIIGLIKPFKGMILLDGEDITGKPERASYRIGYMPQLSRDIDIPLTAFEIVLDSLLLHRKHFPRFASKEDVRKTEETLTLVHLPRDRWNKPFNELSGGEKQRVLLARALVYDPDVLLLDEPLSAIDPLGKVEFVELIGKLSKDKLIIATSHDPYLLLRYSKEIVILNRAYYRIGKPDEILTLEVLSKVYGEAAIRLEEHVHISDAH